MQNTGEKNKEHTTQVIILTYFKYINTIYYNHSFFKKLKDNKLLEIQIHSFIEFAKAHKLKIDDKCYGHGGGMILRVDFFHKIIQYININYKEWLIIHPSPSGELLNIKLVEEFRQTNKFIMICSRYEGIDKRINSFFQLREICIGDYILWDGDTASFVIINTILRHKHVKDKANIYESFYSAGLLDYDKYTRPHEFNGLRVPQEILSGNRKLIDTINFNNMISKTARNRPELYKEYTKTNTTHEQ